MYFIFAQVGVMFRKTLPDEAKMGMMKEALGWVNDFLK